MIELKPLQRKDMDQAIRFAITGMHFDLYLQNRLLLKLYGRYFLYQELERATQIIAAYEGNTLAGLLLADMKGESRAAHSRWRTACVRFVDFIQRLLFRDSAGVYDHVNQELFAQYRENHAPDGEIIFLAANPAGTSKGVGTLLLNELIRREKRKTVFLYTDSACTYQFYARRGFDRVGERDIELDFSGTKVPLTCLMYSRQL